MMFLTLFFIFLTAYSLVKGKLFYKYSLDNAKHEIEKAKGNNLDISTELAAQGMLIIIFALAYLISLLIYVIKAINIDPYLYPTIAYIGFLMSNSITTKTSTKKDLTKEEGRLLYLIKTKKKHSFKGKIKNLISLSFFVYMFLVLVDLVK